MGLDRPARTECGGLVSDVKMADVPDEHKESSSVPVENVRLPLCTYCGFLARTECGGYE